ncbi:MAG TPA: hypothetical protein VMV10_13765 [Pirellulales bacterium]|nr:hypothetical protein [Pirellulales bacterium]
MTEAEWLFNEDPAPMARFLRGRTSDRKLRLLACACCRTVWPSIPAVFQEAIRVAEEHAEGCATDVELGRAVSAAHRARRKGNALERTVYDAARCGGFDPAAVAKGIASVVAYTAAPHPSPVARVTIVGGQPVWEEIPPNADRLRWKASCVSHLLLESSLLRDIIGPLIFRPVDVQAGVLTWNDSAVVKLAQGIYREGAFDRLPILADTLEEAGCNDVDILGHCRQQRLHVRGCWVVGLLLGKE